MLGGYTGSHCALRSTGFLGDFLQPILGSAITKVRLPNQSKPATVVDPHHSPTVAAQPLAQSLGRNVAVLVAGDAQEEVLERIRVETDRRRGCGLDERHGPVDRIGLELVHTEIE